MPGFVMKLAIATSIQQSNDRNLCKISNLMKFSTSPSCLSYPLIVEPKVGLRHKIPDPKQYSVSLLNLGIHSKHEDFENNMYTCRASSSKLASCNIKKVMARPTFSTIKCYTLPNSFICLTFPLIGKKSNLA